METGVRVTGERGWRCAEHSLVNATHSPGPQPGAQHTLGCVSLGAGRCRDRGREEARDAACRVNVEE